MYAPPGVGAVGRTVPLAATAVVVVVAPATVVVAPATVVVVVPATVVVVVPPTVVVVVVVVTMGAAGANVTWAAPPAETSEVRTTFVDQNFSVRMTPSVTLVQAIPRV